MTRTYAYGLTRISENQLVAGVWTPSFYGYDGHGNVRFLANSAASVTDSYDYDAFGMPIRTSGTTPNNYLYSGERYDSSVGLYDLRARYVRRMLFMKFERLQRLSNEKFQKIVNELMRESPAIIIARLILQEWGDCNDVQEDTLATQLKRLHTAITNGAFGGDLAQEAKRKASVRIKLFHGSTLDCKDELIELAIIQRVRVLALWEKERQLNIPLSSLNFVINDYRDLLLSIQKIKFDLGLDEYKGVIPGVKARSASVTTPHDLKIQEQVFEAVATVEHIFRKRGIYAQVNPDA